MSDSDIFAAMDLKKEVEKDKDNLLSPHIAHSYNSSTLEFLDYYKNEWKNISGADLSNQFGDSALFRKVVRGQLTKVLSEAVKKSRTSQIKYITGYNENAKDVSPTNLVKKLAKRVCRDGYCAYLFGKVGSGKTDFALFLSEIWELIEDGEIGSNIESFKQKDKKIECFSDLSNWLKSSSEEKLFVFDEASSYAGGYGKQGYHAQNLIKLLKKFRKYNASLLIIGHTGKDVHPEIRRLCHDIVEKISKKKARFWKKLVDGEGRGVELEITEIPKTNYSYDTQELTTWSWE
ncbi:hypothetical protein C9439_03580 [archaeon SCG-AAA382B04]|nr:hypothetical protein C9439_03580 [archaeon SCG-AAA382B04]